jgi:nicotinate-nucleotide adenylyltransferase
MLMGETMRAGDRVHRSSRVYRGLPPHGKGQAIGLFGGTFNPPHEGHRQASLFALRRLGLDQVWWMVTPGNPLKKNGSLPSLCARMHAAAEVAAHPKIAITGAEAIFRTRYTADLIQILRARDPATRFVWIMGSDSLTDFHRWENWQRLAASVPIAVVNRPQSLAAPLSARAAQGIGRYRIDADDSATLPGRAPPAWVFLIGPRTSASSTAIRSRRSVSQRVLKR